MVCNTEPVTAAALDDHPAGVEPGNTRRRFSGPKHGLNRRSRRARARRCKGESTSSRYDRVAPVVFLNNRHYDPTTGIFVSVDPLVTITGQPYIYGAANPITLSDPSGLEVFGVRAKPEYRCWDDFEGPSDSACPYMNCAGPNTSPRLPSQPIDICSVAPDICGSEPGTSGFGIDAEVSLIGEIGRLPVQEFYDLALDHKEIERLGLDFLDWSNDGCSNSPDSVGGTSLRGPCARHDFSYRNLKAWQDFTGDNIFSKESRRQADDLLGEGIRDVCTWRCDWTSSVYWVGVHGYGDGGPLPVLFGSPWNPNPFPWDGILPGSRW